MTKTKQNILKNIVCAVVLLFEFTFNAVCQDYGLVKGIIKDEDNKPLELVNIGILNTTVGTISDKNGSYEIQVPANKNITLVFSRVGSKLHQTELSVSGSEVKTINVTLYHTTETLMPVEVTEEITGKEGMQKIDIKVINFIPAPGGIEKLVLLTAPGVFSPSELSSTYSVRGGNYDENLVYVNDIEIYRPFLVRSGQQEGLSFLNSDLVQSVLFSSGGFNASYGDKTASVLDIRYRTPDKFSATCSGGLLGGNIHFEGISKGGTFTYLTGIRYKTNKYLLSAMETKGDYFPNFFDLQCFLTKHFSKKTSVSWLGYISKNTYKLIPQTRQTSYGTINEAYRIYIYFSGQEIDRFDLYKNALLFSYKPTAKTQLKFTATGFISDEKETFDILGQYWLGRLETDFGKPDFGEVTENRGTGAFLNHSRNYLNARVINADHRGKHFMEKSLLQWGLKIQHEDIYDKINEWTYIDSAGYSLPHVTDSVGYIDPELQPYQYLRLHDTLFTHINLQSFRYSGFFMFQKEFDINSNKLIFTTGLRANYWDLNQEFLISPRTALSYKPIKQPNVTYRFASGIYHQPPFYRELRNTDGTINTNIKAQRAIHFVGATDIDLIIWRRPFKYSTEIYYKHLDNLIPYVVDNVRIRYLPHLKSKGYATGIDMKIHGEFVADVESWVNLSVMQTKEDIIGDYYFIYYNSDGERIIPGYTFNNIAVDSVQVFPGYIPRPTDQRFNFSLFFQDYFPNNPTFRMHLCLFFGTGLPFGPPNSQKHKHIYRMPPYRRVDIGFSKQIISDEGYGLQRFKSIRNAYLFVEVFNLLQINNVVSYIWIADVTGRLYAVPNYLTPRQLNVRLLIQF